MEPLSVVQLNYISFIEQYYLKHKEFPPVGLLQAQFGKGFSLRAQLEHETFKLALENRGITPPDPESAKFPDNLTDEQIAGVRAVLDFNDKRSQRAKLADLGISTTKWQGWLKNPVFKNFLHNLSKEAFEENGYIAHEGLITGLQRGDTSAIKLYLEVTGQYGGSSGEIQNIKLVLAKVVESIQRHVKDPDTIRAIAQDFEIIMQGGTPTIQKELTV